MLGSSIYGGISGLLVYGAYECFINSAINSQFNLWGALAIATAVYAAGLAFASIWAYSKGNEKERDQKNNALKDMDISFWCFAFGCGFVATGQYLILNHGAALGVLGSFVGAGIFFCLALNYADKGGSEYVAAVPSATPSTSTK